MQPLSPLLPLAGGALIGAAASLLLLLQGRIAGISGILGGLLRPAPGDALWRLLFLGGLLSGPLLVMLVTHAPPQLVSRASSGVIVVAGLLVGFGTRLSSGCTSGHGVCGLARRSKRSLAATLTFMLAGAITVFLLRHVFSGTGAP